MAPGYIKHKSTPLTEEEIKERSEQVKEEMQEVLEWKKETEANLENPKASPQKKGAAKRAMKKITRRIDTINGQKVYWKLRIKGESHFRAGIAMNEYWATCREKAEEKKKKEDEKNLPNLLKKKL